MVRHRSRGRFLREESGISLTEALISLPIVMLAFAAFVEFGFAMFQWNQTVKALQYGARLAAVSDPVAASLDSEDPEVNIVTVVADGTAGNPVPVGAKGPWVCGPNKANCHLDRLNRIVLGTADRPGMQDLNPRIGPDNVVISYELSGLGYYGRPGGAVLTIRMEVRDITFDLPLLGGLLGLDTIEIPPMPVTVTSEDLDTTT